jgi:hypothetical protein
MDCKTLSKVVFIIFVLILTAYIITNNKMQVSTTPTTPTMIIEKFKNYKKNKSLEHFVDEEVSNSPDYTLDNDVPSSKMYNWNDNDRPSSTPATNNSNTTELTSRSIASTSLPPVQSSTYSSVDENVQSVVNENQALTEIRNINLPEQIRNTYKELFGALPIKEEEDFYIRFFQGASATPSQMKEIIATSAPTLKKIISSKVTETQSSPIMIGTEDEVISIYRQILDRNPNEEELTHYASFIKDNPANVEKMKFMLLQSKEYKRLQNMQTNIAYGQLLGGLTDRQITFMVRAIYKQLSDTPIDDETLKFMKKKFLEFKLDEERFKRFVRRFVLFNSPMDDIIESTIENAQSQPIIETSTSAHSPSQSIIPNAEVINELQKSAFSTVPSASPTSSTPSASLASSTPAPTVINSLASSIMNATLSTITESFTQQPTVNDYKPSLILSGNSTGINTAQMIEAIKNQALNIFDKDKFNQDSFDEMNNTDMSEREKELSSFINDRNKEELKNTCVRNKTFSKYHYDDMLLLPKNSASIIPNHSIVDKSDKTMWNKMN